jgi:hypothetical protein
MINLRDVVARTLINHSPGERFRHRTRGAWYSSLFPTLDRIGTDRPATPNSAQGIPVYGGQGSEEDQDLTKRTYRLLIRRKSKGRRDD